MQLLCVGQYMSKMIIGITGWLLNTDDKWIEWEWVKTNQQHKYSLIWFKSLMVSVCLSENEQRQRSPGHHVSSLNVHFDRIMKIIAADPSAHCLSGG